MITHNHKKNLLIERIKTNYHLFQLTYYGVSREKLIKMSRRTAAVTDTYNMLTKRYEWNNAEEIEFFLLFRDPLTIIADAWERRRYGMSEDFANAMRDIKHSDYIIAEYPLIESSAGNICNNITIKDK